MLCLPAADFAMPSPPRPCPAGLNGSKTLRYLHGRNHSSLRHLLRATPSKLAATVLGGVRETRGGCDMRPGRRPPAAGKLLGPAHQRCGTLARLSSQLRRKLAGARLRQLPRAFWSPAAKAAASWPGSALHGCSKLVCVRPLRAHTSSSWFPPKFPSGQLGL